MSGVASALAVGPGPVVSQLGLVGIEDILTRAAGGGTEGISRAELALALDKSFLASPTPAPNATFTWGANQPNVEVTHAGAKCVITVPGSADVASWAVGEARRLAVANVGGFGIGFAVVATVGFNYAAVGAGVTTVTGSNVISSATVNVPVYTVLRKSAASYLIFAGW